MKALYRKTIVLESLNAETPQYPSGLPVLTGDTEIGVGIDIPEAWLFSISGTWGGSIQFLTTGDNINWYPIVASDSSKSTADNDTISSNGLFKILNLQGKSGLACKCKMKTYSNGSANIAIIELHSSRED